jgi:hypothetical protein
MSLSSFIAKTGINPTFIAFNAHCWFAYAVTFTARAHWVALAVVIAAAVKEFSFDARFEVPKQTTADNVEDFSGYVSGAILGTLALIYLK